MVSSSGLGVGGFAEYAILGLRYPHNLFLEVASASELGLLPLLGLLILCAWTLRTLVHILRTEYTWFSLYLSVVVLTSLANSMVMGI